MLVWLVVGRCDGDFTQFGGVVGGGNCIWKVVANNCVRMSVGGGGAGNRGSAAMSGGGGTCVGSGGAS